MKSPVVRRGRIKVDARRAVAKLREHLLLDPDTWPLEVVRAAVLGGATGVHVEHDADDLVLTFDGEPLAPDTLPRLLDHALESSRDDRGRRLRLLAIAVNASLAGASSQVEVAVREGDGASVARFEPSVVRDDGDGEADRPRVRRAPAGALRGGAVSIAARKGFGWGTFVRFATGRALREAQLVAAATRHAALDVVLDPPIPDATGRPVLRLDLEPHGVPGGVLDVVDGAAAEAGARLSFLELGVALAEIPIASSDAIATSGSGVAMPVVVRIDAPQWPTNASRSQVHEREARRVHEEVVRALPAAARALARAAGVPAPDEAGRAEVPGVLLEPPTAAAAERALSAFACCAAASADDGPLDFVLDLPIARDAIGRRVTPRALVALVRRAAESAGAERVFVHRGAEALPDVMAPFARDVPWLRGHPIERLLDAVHVRDFAEVHDDVARGLRRRDALLALPAREPHVPAGAGELLRVRFAETTGELAGLSGELVVHLRRDRPLLRVLVEGRPFATFHPATFLPIDAAVEWPDRLRPALGYDALVADGSAERAAAVLLERASRELAARADRLAAPDAPEEARTLARAALAATPEARTGPLRSAPLWRTASGARASLADIDGASASGAVAFVQKAPSPAIDAADRRLVLVLDGEEATVLTTALGRPVELVPYGPALLPADDRARRIDRAHRALVTRELRAQGRVRAAVIRFTSPGSRGLAATGARGVLIRTHAGIELTSEPLPGGAPAIVVIEEDAIVPTPGWDGIRHPAAPDLADAVRGLVDTVRGLAVSAGDDVAEERAEELAEEAQRGDAGTTAAARLLSLLPEVGVATRADARSWALAALAAARQDGKGSKGGAKVHPYAEPLVDVEVAVVLGPDGEPMPASLAAIRQRHGDGPVPYLRVAPDFPTLDWRPLLVTRRDEIGALSALGLRLVDAEGELPKRQENARTELARRAVAARAPIALEPPVPGAADDAPTARHDAEGATARGKATRGLRVLVALAPGVAGRCAVRWTGRPVADVTLDGAPPGVASIVDTRRATHLERWAKLSAAGMKEAAAAIVEASRTLAMRLIAGSDDRPLAEAPIGRAGALELLAALLPAHPPLAAALRLCSVRLPCALGGEVALVRALQGEGPIAIARERFDATLAAHVVDPPVLLGPDDARLEALLLALGPALDDVTGALRHLAAPDERRVGLDGAPLHPVLRASLDDLGVTGLVGEIELTDEASSSVRIALHDGSVRSPSTSLPFAVKVAARPARLDSRGRVLKDAGATIERAARALAERAAPHAADLPPFARAALRAAVVAACARGERPRKALLQARVFVDVTGRATSLGALLERKGTRVTTMGPPWPATATGSGRDAVVPVDAAEVLALRKGGVLLSDVTLDLQLDAEAEIRARAPRVEAALPPAIRRVCLGVDGWSEGGRAGELGLLRGAERDAAGITVLLDRRPLCTLKPPEGWPVAAVWNDDGLTPNRRRDGLAPASQGQAIVRAVEARRDALLRSLLREPPPGALASTFVEARPPGLTVLARLWLVPETEDAELHLRWAGARADERRVRLEAPSLPAGYPLQLPVGGDAFVVPDVRFATIDPSHEAALGRTALDALPALLEHVPGGAGPRLLWHAALLGAKVEAPPVRDAAGGLRHPQEILRELRRRGALWVTRHAGVSLGDFPSAAPAFVLLDDGASPLLDLLEDRAPGLVRELGGLVADAAAAPAPSTAASASDGDVAAAPARRKKRRKRRQDPSPERPAPRARTAPEPTPTTTTTNTSPSASPVASPPPGPSWLARLGAGVKELITGPPPKPLAEEHPIRRAVLDAARRVGLEPPPDVVAAPRGRPAVRFDEEARRVEIVLEHPAIEALLAAREMEVIAAAAIGAMNDALHEVTDAEELRAVADLLAARATRG